MVRARPLRLAVVLLLASVFGGDGSAQIKRHATTAEALLAAAGFFHGRTVVLTQKIAVEGDYTRLVNTPKPIYVFWSSRPTRDEGEVRGEFWDLGRMGPGDTRFTGYDFARLVEFVNRGQWPRRDQMFVLVRASMLPSLPSPGPTLRAIALQPQDYVDREVKVVGRFMGRNLYGDLPSPIAQGKWDFVLQSADGTLWVTGVRPRGKGFDLDPSKRVDTGRWLEVTGVVKMLGVTPYVDARAVALSAPPEEKTVEVELPPPPRQPPPEVIFSAPIEDDRDVETTAPVRIQFSRDMDPRTIQGKIRVAYVTPATTTPLPPPPAFTVRYNDMARAIEIRFTEPLQTFQQVRVELLEGMTALDGQPLKPWSLTFSTGRQDP